MSQKVADKNSYSLTANMFIAFIITFAAGTIGFEENSPEKFIVIYSTVVTLLCFVTWLLLSFISGRNNKWQFVVFSSLFWILPHVVIYLANDGPEVFRMSITMYLLSEFMTITTLTPLEAVGEVINVKVIPFTAIVILLCIFSYLGGYLTIDKDAKDQQNDD